MRDLVRETRLAPEDFVLPLFACPGERVRREISSMPGVHNLSVDEIAKEAAGAQETGIKAVILFGLPEAKDEQASGAYRSKRNRAAGGACDSRGCARPRYYG